MRRLLCLLAALASLCAATAGAEPNYTQDVRPLLERRCVVCHACYDAPCQLKLGVWEGLLRGASKDKVYDGTRLQEAAPTRLFVDAHSSADWRRRGFQPVVGEGSSVLQRMLDLKERNPLPAQAVLPPDFDFSLDRKQVCPAPQEMDAFERQHPQWGMPFGLPALRRPESATLQAWLHAGAPRGAVPKLAPAALAQVRQWERFFNGNSTKERLVSRYLYEHLFMAHLHFDAGAGQPFFHLVRSSTPPGQDTVPIATRRPTDDPGVARVYYRLVWDRDSIVDKTHMPFALTAQRLAHWRAWFLDAPYTVQQLPSYAPAVASNPFVVYRAIPSALRYRFLLDEAQFFIMGFIKGPVCRGQVALNVIDDHFWVFFYRDARAGSGEGEDELLRQQAHNLALPAEQSSQTGVIGPWLNYALQERGYLKAKSAFMARKAAEGTVIDLEQVWDGDGENSNAALTVFRHFDNASVVRGLVGEEPKTAWVISYPLLERIHYLLVAGFDVYGNVGHQLLSRLYMDFLRMEGEYNFLMFLPRATRPALHHFWYRGATPEADLFLDSAQAESALETGIHFQTAQPQHELYGLLRTRLAPVLEQRYDLDRVEDAALRQPLAALQSVRGRALDWLPGLSYLRLDAAGQPPRYFTLLRNTGRANVSQLLSEKLSLLPEENTLTVVPGFIGSYPNALYRVPRAQLGAFTSALGALASEADYRAFADHYALRRSDPQFWSFSDQLQDAHLRENPLENGLLDYNRLENR